VSREENEKTMRIMIQACRVRADSVLVVADFSLSQQGKAG